MPLLNHFSRWKAFGLINLGIAIFFPATALIQKYSGLIGVSLYSLVVFGALIFITLYQTMLLSFADRFYPLLLTGLISGLVVIFILLYPLETSGQLGIGSDRDEALNIAVKSLWQGQYPYYQKTHLGNGITPFPGALLFAAPFVALGNSAYQNFFWLLVFAFVTQRYLKDKTSTLLLIITIFVLSPALQYEFISGGDLLANSIYILVGTFWVLQVFSDARSSWWAQIASSFMLGVALASRLNFILGLPLLWAILVRNSSVRRATLALGGSVLVATFISLPFYWYDPSSFTPLTVGNKLTGFNQLGSFVSQGIIIATLMLSIFLAIWLMRTTWPQNIEATFFYLLAVVQFFPIACAVSLQTVISGYIDFSFLQNRYGLMFTFFGLWGCWTILIKRAQPPQVAASSSVLVTASN